MMARRKEEKMNTAKKLTTEEILSLPLGSVVWYEEHCSYDNPEQDIHGIPFYFLYPLMVAGEGADFTLIGAREGCCPDYWGADAVPLMVIWDRKPNRKQLKGFDHWDIDAIPEETLREMTAEQGTGLTALKSRINWEYGSVSAFAHRIGINPRSMLRKLNGTAEFKAHEMTSIVKTMHFSNPEANRYFFAG